jgi:hypothetical protein
MGFEQCFMPEQSPDWTKLDDEERQEYKKHVLEYYIREQWAMKWAYGQSVHRCVETHDSALTAKSFFLNNNKWERMVRWFGRGADHQDALVDCFFGQQFMNEQYADEVQSIGLIQYEGKQDIYGSALEFDEIDTFLEHPYILTEDQHRMKYPLEDDVRNVQWTDPGLCFGPDDNLKTYQSPVMPLLFQSEEEAMDFKEELDNFFVREEIAHKYGYMHWREATKNNRAIKKRAKDWVGQYGRSEQYLHEYEAKWLEPGLDKLQQFWIDQPDMLDDMEYIVRYLRKKNAYEYHVVEHGFVNVVFDDNGQIEGYVLECDPEYNWIEHYIQLEQTNDPYLLDDVEWSHRQRNEINEHRTNSASDMSRYIGQHTKTGNLPEEL